MLVYLSNFVVILKLWQVIQTLRSFWCILIICPPSICLLCSTSYVWRTFLLADKMTTKFCFESKSILSCIKPIMLVLTSYCSSWSVPNWSTARPKEPKVPRRTSLILQSAPASVKSEKWIVDPFYRVKSESHFWLFTFHFLPRGYKNMAPCFLRPTRNDLSQQALFANLLTFIDV